MKRYTFLLLIIFHALGVDAQSSYDGIRLMETDLSGTARYVGMGGSMGALGADLSVIRTNPAGIGVYRSGDVAVSAGLTTLKNESDYFGSKIASDKTSFTIDNLGIVFSNEVNSGSLKYFNIGVALNHKRNLNREFGFAGAAGFMNANNEWVPLSQMYQMQRMYDISPFDVYDMSYTNYTNLNNYWLALLAADGGLLGDEGGILFDATDNCFYSEEKGGVKEVDCNVSCNLNDRLYLGVSVGLYYVDYSRYSYYGEDDELGEIYTLHNWYEQTGSGFDVKLGLILRPFKYSPLKMGFALHTPTFYSLTDRVSARIEGVENDYVTGVMDTHDYDYSYGDDYYVDYNVKTPWRFLFSTSYTFGNVLALNAEYEYADYSKAEMEYHNGSEFRELNGEINNNMRCVKSFRLGAECNVDKNISLRCGYNYVSAPFKKTAGKYVLSTADTNTEYLNSLTTNSFSIGAGYRDKSMYLDFAYNLSLKDADFYPYYDPEVANPPASVEESKHHVVLTLGWRF